MHFSFILGHTTAEDMVKHFDSAVLESGYPISQMIQISMDGPNVNWKFYSIIREKISADFDTKLINIGSCGLHVIHNSFKTGATASGWDISSILTSLYRLFKDAPARREDYTKITGSLLMPQKFCGHRWLENIPVCERALQLWENIEAFVKAVKEKTIANPGNKSYATLKEATNDPLIKCKLCFFQCVANHLQPFLALYQTDKPMVMFLAGDLSNMIRALMRKFLQDDVLAAASTDDKLLKIDVTEKKIHKTYKQIELGFSTEKELKEVVKKGGLSQKQVMEFRIDCRTFLIRTLQKIMMKCPLSFSLVRNLTALDPRQMVNNPTHCRESMKKVLTVLVNANKVKEKDCDAILVEYGNFLDKIPVIGSTEFSSYSPTSHRIDEFFVRHLSLESFQKLLPVVKLLLVLSHGQASVERGFSINKEAVVDNLSQRSTVARRVVCDHVRSVGAVLKVSITKELMQSVCSEFF